MDHGAFGPDREPGATDCQAAGEELGRQRFDVEDVAYHGAVEEADQLWNAGPARTRSQQHDARGHEAEEEAIAKHEAPRCEHTFMFVNEFLSLLPFQLRKKIDELVQEKAQETHCNPDKAHHHPAIPVHAAWLATQPGTVGWTVRWQIIETFIGIEHVAFVGGVTMIGVNALKITASRKE